MRVIERLQQYLKHHHLAPYTFERNCGIANGYLKKQIRGKGTIGSEILEKITAKYRDINLPWLLTGKGSMLIEHSYSPGEDNSTLAEQESGYSTTEQTIKLLKEKILILENALSDKEKIIKLLEKQLSEK